MFDVPRKIVLIVTGVGAGLPLFWGWSKNGVVVSDSALGVYRSITDSDCLNPDDLDKVALVEASLFDGPLVHRTLYKNVHKVQMAEAIRIDLRSKATSSTWRWLPRIQADNEVPRNQVEEKARHLVSDLLKQATRSGDVLLPITGGLDSRLLATLARKSGQWKEIYSYTAGRNETYCAKKVSRQLGTQHILVGLRKDCFRDTREAVKTAARKEKVRAGIAALPEHRHPTGHMK